MDPKPRPPGPGWKVQAHRWRIQISLTPDVATKLGVEAERLGVSPAVLAAMIVSEKMNASQKEA